MLDSTCRRLGEMASNSIGPERHHLARQVQSFRNHAKKLKRIFKDTVKVLSDLQDFDESLSIDQILAVNAQKCISNVVSGRTALVVLGEAKLRASIVNEILGKHSSHDGYCSGGLSKYLVLKKFICNCCTCSGLAYSYL